MRETRSLFLEKKKVLRFLNTTFIGKSGAVVVGRGEAARSGQ